MKNVIFSAKFTLTPLGVTLVNLRGSPQGGSINFPETFWRMFELVLTFGSVNSYNFHS